MSDEEKPVVLAVFAHPDDDELSCGGTLAWLSHAGYHVCALEVTAGERSATARSYTRKEESLAASELLGYTLIQGALPDGKVRYDIDLVSLIEHTMALYSPSVIITHYPQERGLGHQDHAAVSAAAVNTARRNPMVRWILYAEPPTQAWDFSPNCFVDITAFLSLKLQAVGLHCSEREKAYMKAKIVETRARWWAMQANPHEADENRFFEAFVVVKGMLNPGLFLTNLPTGCAE